eukprot:CAMPEP_0194534638 /NCGR_PEP_ID=MMETSP0253-20130528/72914_1 /TAXON_ID=2966 /ORGANISM="Noctiluca scintillans" /LENGTH=522 /DNA_ID=CAMNT_0039380329 /DNA_START=84 /DNA_END=1648 /DNA_ORIENTATION=-
MSGVGDAGEGVRHSSVSRAGKSVKYAVLALVCGVVSVGVAWVFPANSRHYVSRVPLPKAKVYQAECSAHQKCVELHIQGLCCPGNGKLQDCCDPIPSTAEFAGDYGMCYSPEPFKEEGNTFPCDDFMGNWAAPFWKKRGDLDVIRKLNITTVRLYGNDMTLDHKEFLDELEKYGMQAVIGISDEPYLQDFRNRCGLGGRLDYNCRWTIQDQFEAMLQKGFTRPVGDGTRRYHPAVKAIIVINEPELKIQFNLSADDKARAKGYYAKAAISALDGMLSAEENMHVVGSGSLPPFTVTHSFATCPECKSANNTVNGSNVGGFSALPFMYDFVHGCLDPSFLDYRPKHDLRAALQNRFVLGFNTQNDRDSICTDLLGPLGASPLVGLPVWVGEYKPVAMSDPSMNPDVFEGDLRKMRHLVDGGMCNASAARLRALSVFEFQVAYDKGPFDLQMVYGIHVLGNRVVAHTHPIEQTNWTSYRVWCLRQRRRVGYPNESWVAPLAQVFGGSLTDDSWCPIDPDHPADL